MSCLALGIDEVIEVGAESHMVMVTSFVILFLTIEQYKMIKD